MDRYFLDEVEIPSPKGIDGLTRQKGRSRRYFSVLYNNIGYASGVGNTTFTDALSRRLLMTPYRALKLAAEVRFRMETEGLTDFDSFVDYTTFSYDNNGKDGVTCAFRDGTGITTLENQAVTRFSVPTGQSVRLDPKQLTGATTHTVSAAASIVQRSTADSRSIDHSVPLVRPDKATSTLPGQLLTVENPGALSPLYRNTTADAQSLLISGPIQLSFSASANLTARLVVLVYAANGQAEEVRQGEFLVTNVVNNTTILVRANLLVQPGGWVVVGFRSDQATQRFAFTYGPTTAITLESTNQAPASTCAGLLAADLLAALVSKSSDGRFSFRSDYLTTGEGAGLFVTSGANLRGIDKAVTTSLQDVFEGLSAPIPLALWIAGSVVRIEPLLTYLTSYTKRTYIDQEPISVKYKPNVDYIASEVLTGFETWQGSGPLSGDEFNGNRQYLSPLKHVRKTLDLRAKTLIASGTLIEEQRRKQFSDGTAASTQADGNDDKLYLIATTSDRNGILVNETRQRTSYIDGVVDGEATYNVNLSPRRSLARWAQILPLAPLALESSAGNAKMNSQYRSESKPIGEGDPLPASTPQSVIGDELATVVIAMTQQQFNDLGDWINFYDNGDSVSGLLMDATWRTTLAEGGVCTMVLFL